MDLNKVMLIGNLTRDPELRYTPAGQAVISFGLATNRRWADRETGERKEQAEFHNIVAWGKLAETCSQILKKGRKVYVEGRLQTRNWEGEDGAKRSRTEIIANNVIVLDRKPEEPEPEEPSAEELPETMEEPVLEKEEEPSPPPEEKRETVEKKEQEAKEKENEEGIDVDDIPF